MDYTTVEAEIDHGRITVKAPDRLPERAHGLLILFPSKSSGDSVHSNEKRVRLPLIRGSGQRIIDPTPEELDESTWD